MKYSYNWIHKYSWLDYLLIMTPTTKLLVIVTLVNRVPQKENQKEKTIGELMKFFGIWVLTNKSECWSREYLWNTTYLSKYVLAPYFGNNEMSRPIFDTIWECICFSEQPYMHPKGMSFQAYWWRLVNDYVRKIINNREAMFTPSTMICADEYISPWYAF